MIYGAYKKSDRGSKKGGFSFMGDVWIKKVVVYINADSCMSQLFCLTFFKK